MNKHSNNGQDAGFDDNLRHHHAQSVANLSARTQAQLQLRRRAASRPIRPVPLRGYAWALAAACAVGVLAVGLQWRRPDLPVAATTPVAIGPGGPTAGTESVNDDVDAYAMFDEAPDLYLWLASDDAAALAME